MAPRNYSISMAQYCCCVLKPIPGGFSWRKLPRWLKCLVLCKCIIGHITFWFGAFLLIFWLVFLPHEPRFTVTDAPLTQFIFSSSDSSTGTNLHYHLALNITIRNPNRRVGIYYRSMTVSASYRKKKFGLVNLTDPVPFYQGHKNTTLLHHLVLKGQQQLVKFGKRDISQFDKETVAGVYSINVQVTFRVNVRYGKNKVKFLKPETYDDQHINCKLKLPFSVTNETSGNGFKATKCDGVGIFKDLPY
ncbi:PREDICTED: protein YLS9-like [Fragaria vesca subsp. vesca]|uniref:protein YLS9-like n=1 Tax=Fragaria vesca subsp. vesca TaxID=101020 RepID=UPI0002C2EDD0|nr:PREDICTED: protein YLS9-like [Fragaria vesca subsp. vesca]